jgi:hypothetical protein
MKSVTFLNGLNTASACFLNFFSASTRSDLDNGRLHLLFREIGVENVNTIKEISFRGRQGLLFVLVLVRIAGVRKQAGQETLPSGYLEPVPERVAVRISRSPISADVQNATGNHTGIPRTAGLA